MRTTLLHRFLGAHRDALQTDSGPFKCGYARPVDVAGKDIVRQLDRLSFGNVDRLEAGRRDQPQVLVPRQRAGDASDVERGGILDWLRERAGGNDIGDAEMR